MALRTYLFRLFKGAAAILLYVRDKRVRIVLYSLLVFPATFANLYLAASKQSLDYAWAALFSLADTIGASVYKVYQAVQLLQGDISREAAFRTSEFGGPTVDLLQSALPSLPFDPLNAIGAFLVDLLISDPLLAGYMIVSAALTPYLFWKMWGVFIRTTESTTPAIGHYTLMVVVYVLFTVVYGLQNGVGPDILLQTAAEVQELLDALAQGPATAPPDGNTTIANATNQTT